MHTPKQELSTLSLSVDYWVQSLRHRECALKYSLSFLTSISSETEAQSAESKQDSRIYVNTVCLLWLR